MNWVVENRIVEKTGCCNQKIRKKKKKEKSKRKKAKKKRKNGDGLGFFSFFLSSFPFDHSLIL